MRALTAALFMGTALVATASRVAADNSSRDGLTVIPPVTDVNIDPGRMVTVQVKVDKGATVASFAPTKKFFEHGPLGFAVRVRDEGNAVVYPQGTVTISNIFGTKMAVLALGSHRVLPNSIRRLDVSWKHHWPIGPYKAKLVWSYAGKVQPAKTVTVWAAPLDTIGAILAVAAVLFVALWLPRRRPARAFRAAVTAVVAE